MLTDIKLILYIYMKVEKKKRNTFPLIKPLESS